MSTTSVTVLWLRNFNDVFKDLHLHRHAGYKFKIMPDIFALVVSKLVVTRFFSHYGACKNSFIWISRCGLQKNSTRQHLFNLIQSTGLCSTIHTPLKLLFLNSQTVPTTSRKVQLCQHLLSGKQQGEHENIVYGWAICNSLRP